MTQDEKDEKDENVIIETDADLEDSVEKEGSPEDVSEGRKKGGRGDIEIGGYTAHLNSTKKGMFEYHIWPSITIAVLAQAMPNTYHRIDLRDKETLQRLEKDLELTIDYEYINGEIMKKPWLVQPNGTKPPADKTKDASGKPLTKKAMKANAKREKIQAKIDVIKEKIKKIKNKNGPRVEKLRATLDELVHKRDRII